jgi:hypothetical protein
LEIKSLGMNVNVGKYNVKDIKKTVEGQTVKCKFLKIEPKYDLLTIEAGDDLPIKIINAFYEIDPEGYWWELDVMVENDGTRIFDIDRELHCIITNLDLMDNFYEQVTKK